MEKENNSLPMRVFSNFPIDTKISNATKSSMHLSQPSIHRNPNHPRLSDVQTSSNEIIDLTSAAVGQAISANSNAPARSYELSKINNNMISIYDVSHNSNAVEIESAKCFGALQGISKGTKKSENKIYRRLKIDNP